MRKICIVTGSRSEYGLLYWLLKEISSDKNLKLQLIVTGMHLSKEFGLTYREIIKEFGIDEKINMNLKPNSSLNISKSMNIAQKSFLKTFIKLKPNIVVLLGDRYEILSAAIASIIIKLPIAHIHGGELTKGSWDDNIRHSITKMSHLHFTANEIYRKRVIQLGEEPHRVFNVGGLGIENIKKLKFLSKKEFEKSINFKLNKKNLLVTFHPVTLENETSKKHFQELLKALSELRETNIIFTKSNSDLDGLVINNMIDKYVQDNRKNSIGFFSLGQLRFLSALQHVDAIVGNSSSGLLEAPSFKIATINIGDRQKGRIKAMSVINCVPKKNDIKRSIKKIYSKKFKNLLEKNYNPYDNGLASRKILKVLKNFNLKHIIKKNFYDINF